MTAPDRLLTIPLPAAVREILSDVLHDFEGHISHLYDEPGTAWTRWLERMETDLEPLAKLLAEDEKLRGER